MINTLPKSPSLDPPPTATNQSSKRRPPNFKLAAQLICLVLPIKERHQRRRIGQRVRRQHRHGSAVPLFVWVLITGDDGEHESLGRTGGGSANVCVISNSDAGVAAA
jgi:hypothetical protein